MSGLSDHLHTGQTGAPVGCGESQAEEKGCIADLEGLEGLEGPEFWTRELGLQGVFQDPSQDGLALVTSDHIPPSSPSALANGLHLQRRLGHSTCRRRQTETHTTETHTFAETLRNMQTHIDPNVHAHSFSHAHMDINTHTGSVGPELSKTLTSEAMHTASPQPLSLALGNHSASTNQLAAPVRTTETDTPSPFCPVPAVPNPNVDSSPLPVETEKKYALRSSGRPRFPCHLRKSSRLRRSIEDGEKRAGREKGEEDDEVLEEKIFTVKEEEVAVGDKEEHSTVEAVLPTPTSLVADQKSYKISNWRQSRGQRKVNDGSVEGSEAVREPTALLRMKNNGKSVMVMFPPGELPVILKRRRGRPPKQPLPGIQGEPQNAVNPGGNGDQPKSPGEYGDVLSKLAFLNRQPPATGRCSPPRCWTPSEPESFHAPLENPGISTLLHRRGRWKRWRSSRGIGGTECNKSTFSDFFESIGKKRKLSPLSEHGLPRKGGRVRVELVGEEKVRKKRIRKMVLLKGAGCPWGRTGLMGQVAGGRRGHMNKEKGFGGYQLCGSPRGGFSSCEMGRGGAYSSSGGNRRVGPAGEDSQGLFAGYFRSLLDSDDSSDLLDISSQSDHRKASSTPGYESSSPATSHSWSPAFPKWSSKGGSSGVEGPAQTHGSSTRPPYSYGSLAQTSPTTSAYPKSTPPSLSHSPSSPHPASYGHYSSGYSCSSPAVPQRSSDCSFAYGSGHSSGKTTPVGQMGYSSYQASAKRAFSGYPGARGESTGPTSPGGGYMSVAKSSPFSSSSSEGYKQFSSQWNFRHGYGGWSAEGFGPQYHGYGEYGSNESKDILDISNYTPQKAKRQPFPESLSESSSDSSHLGSAAPGCGPGSTGGGQSSLSSLEKLMMDWHESASGPSYNWSQNVLFQGGGTSKPGRGRRKRTEPHSDKDGGSGLHSDSPSSPSPTPTPGPKRGGVGGRGRGSRGGRGGLSPCQREHGSGLFQEGLDYYSGDSSSLSPLATPNPAPPSSYLQEPCEYPSPYSAHPSTPSSEERYPALYPGESSSSLSPSVSSPPYPLSPPLHRPSRTTSPPLGPSPPLAPHHHG
uniref:AT hook, DNA binding motif, containing 1 n=1 Tax=Amphiprion percula TaxID=161767 RepID=A0A3P8T6G4_AMPPE